MLSLTEMEETKETQIYARILKLQFWTYKIGDNCIWDIRLNYAVAVVNNLKMSVP